MSNRLITADKKIIVIRRYLKPIPVDPVFESMRKTTNRYRTLQRSKMCITCPNIATQWLYSDVDGATFTERYCDDCIKQEKHLGKSELMDNFDNLFIRAEPDTQIYKQFHAKNSES
jgi:hypothetical protein